MVDDDGRSTVDNGRTMTWDPNQYLRFADHRSRPGIELLARVPDIDPRTIVDLGCGMGNLTSLLAARWPNARVIGLDSSAEMIDRARSDHPELEWAVASVDDWEPVGSVGLIYSNATLHWLDDHDRLFSRLRSHLSPGGVLAVQMPDNWTASTHRIPGEVLDSGDWPQAARAALIRDRLSRPANYARWLQPADVDLWRTTYFQQLTGDDPVWNWVTGSVLRPVLAALNGDDSGRFAAMCKERYREAYPTNANGTTTLPFSRLFVVARSTTTS
ncbi:MAG: methyltransferase domain-containing protein [Actinomycetia bacterium]|nr:methyltransferase domain-containing protein [Actinomycetes bacterium]